MTYLSNSEVKCDLKRKSDKVHIDNYVTDFASSLTPRLTP